MEVHRPTTVAADPELWSDKRKQSYSYHYIGDYLDIRYVCSKCRADSVFTAQDQKYTFETKKASIDQRRSLCGACWSEAHRIRAQIADFDARWLDSKAKLQKDLEFLKHWMALLVHLEEFSPYKPDTAKKNMIQKMLRSSGQTNPNNEATP
nr:zinc-ribbon domain containing protein [uncultured Rhodoferax sp.]